MTRLTDRILGKIKYLRDDGRPQTLIRTGGSTGGSAFGDTDRTTQKLEEFWKYYRGEGTVFASLNSTAYNTVMVGYNITSKNPEAKNLISDSCDMLNLEESLWEATRDSLVFGDSFIEKRRNRKGDVVKLKPVDPRTIVINYNQYGDIESYKQVIGGKTVNPKIPKEDIIHFRFLPIPGSPYGVSLIEPNVEVIKRKVSVEEALFNAMKRHGTGKWVLYVGNEKDGQIPPDSVMDSIAEKLEDINDLNEVVLPWFMHLETIDEKGIEGVEEYYDYFQTQLVVGLMCPEEALGQGKGSTEATARVKSVMYERMIKSYQRRLSKILHDELFEEILLKQGFKNETYPDYAIKVTLEFNSVTEEDEALKAKWWSNIIRSFRGDIPLTGNEFRTVFGFPTMDGLDKLMTNQSDSDEEPEEEEEEPEEEEPKEVNTEEVYDEETNGV